MKFCGHEHVAVRVASTITDETTRTLCTPRLPAANAAPVAHTNKNPVPSLLHVQSAAGIADTVLYLDHQTSPLYRALSNLTSAPSSRAALNPALPLFHAALDYIHSFDAPPMGQLARDRILAIMAAVHRGNPMATRNFDAYVNLCLFASPTAPLPLWTDYAAYLEGRIPISQYHLAPQGPTNREMHSLNGNILVKVRAPALFQPLTTLHDVETLRFQLRRVDLDEFVDLRCILSFQLSRAHRHRAFQLHDSPIEICERARSELLEQLGLDDDGHEACEGAVGAVCSTSLMVATHPAPAIESSPLRPVPGTQLVHPQATLLTNFGDSSDAVVYQDMVTTGAWSSTGFAFPTSVSAVRISGRVFGAPGTAVISHGIIYLAPSGAPPVLQPNPNLATSFPDDYIVLSTWLAIPNSGGISAISILAEFDCGVSLLPGQTLWLGYLNDGPWRTTFSSIVSAHIPSGMQVRPASGPSNRAMHASNGNIDRAVSDDILSERLRASPFSGLTVDDFDDLIRSQASQLPRASHQVLLTCIDEQHLYLPGTGAVYRESEANFDPARARAQASTSVAKTSTVGSPPPCKPVLDPAEPRRPRVDLARQRQHVVSRVVAKFQVWGDLVDWLYGGDPVDPILGGEVLDAALRRQPALPVDHIDSWTAKSTVAQRSRSHIFHGLCSFIPSLRELLSAPVFDEWMTTVMSVPPAFSRDAPRPFPANFDRATAMGKTDPGPLGRDAPRPFPSNFDRATAMGKTDPGPKYAVFPNRMREIEACPSLRPLLEGGPTAGAEFDPVSQTAEISGRLGVGGVQMSSIPRTPFVRSATSSSTSVVTVVSALPKSWTWTTPFEVRAGSGGALIPSTRRPQLWGVASILGNAVTQSVQSPEMVAAGEVVARLSFLRPDQLTALGNYLQDFYAQGCLGNSGTGDNLVTPLLKLRLYSQILAAKNPVNFQPIGCEFGAYDSFTQVAPGNPAVTLGFNDATVFGADCGGLAAPVFPYVEGDAPTIAFHRTMQTIPSGAAFVAIRGSLCLQGDLGFPALNIALMAAAYAPYPCGIHTIGVDTVDDLGGNAAVQGFIHNASLVHIPGINSLHILLTNANAGPPPTTDTLANNNVLVRPTAGPVNAGALLANQPLQISYIAPGGLVYYDMADYLASWFGAVNGVVPINTTSINRLSKQLTQLYARGKDYRFAFDAAALLVNRFPAMQASNPAAAAVPAPVNSAQSSATQNFMALTPHGMTQDYPEEFTQYDLYVPDTSLQWANQIMMGSYIPVPDGSVNPPRSAAWDGTPQLTLYAGLCAQTYAVAAEYMFSYYQMPRSVWNSAFSQLNYQKILTQIRGIFASSAGAGVDAILVSDLGESLAGLMARVTGVQAAENSGGYTPWDYWNTPRVGFQGVWNGGAVLDTPIPSILPDVWIQSSSVVIPQALSPFLGPLKMLTGLRSPGHSVISLGGGRYSAPIATDQTARDCGLESLPLPHDSVVFNSRMAWHLFNADLCTTGGTVYNASTVPSGWLVTQKYQVPDFYLGAPASYVNNSILSAKTFWIPFMNLDGERLTVSVSAANGADLLTTIMGGRTNTGLATWLMSGATAMPNTIVDGAGDNTQSHIPSRRQPGNASPASEPVSEAGSSASHSSAF